MVQEVMEQVATREAPASAVMVATVALAVTEVEQQDCV